MSLHITKCGDLKSWTSVAGGKPQNQIKFEKLNFSENGEADRLSDVPRFCEVSSKVQNA